MQPIATTGYQYSAIQSTTTEGTQIVFVPIANSKVVNKYKAIASITLGTLQIIFGVLFIIFNSVAIAYLDNGPSVAGHGIWCGVLFIVTGSFGVCAGKSKTKCKIVTFMVLCIISAAMTTILLILGVMTAVFIGDRSYYCRSGSYNYGNSEYNSEYYRDRCYSAKIEGAMGACMAFFAVLEATAAIWGSAICCKAVCCGAEAPVTGVLYQSNPNGQIILIGQPNQQIQVMPSSVQVVPSQGQQPGMPTLQQYGQAEAHHQAVPSVNPFGHHGAPPSYAHDHLGYSNLHEDCMEKPLLP